jgi:hypothetical protein
MYCKKVLYLKPEQKTALEDIQNKIEKNGGKVSCMRLMQDSIRIFLDYYQDSAIEKYSSNYAKNS